MNSDGGARMTVVQLLPALESGGVERGTLEVGRELVRHGHRSIVVSAPGRMLADLTAAGIEHVSWPIGVKSPMTLRWLLPLRRLLREQRVDILHARSRVPAWLGYLTWRSMAPAERPRFLTTVHSIYSVSAYSAIMTRGERVIAISKTVEDYIKRNYAMSDHSRMRVIYRGIDEQEFAPGHRPSVAWRASFHNTFPEVPDDRPILTLPGRLVRRKGHLDFIAMLAALRHQGVTFHAMVVGGQDPRRSHYAEQVKQAVREHNLEDCMTFTGDRSDMADIYGFSTIVYCPSAEPVEAFGRTVVEALNTGTPVIGYNHGGVGETLTALLPEGRVAPGDIDGLLERTMAFLRTPPQPRPNTMFTRQAMLDATLALYEEVVGTRHLG